MVLTNTGKSGAALLLGSIATPAPRYIAIGSGSGTASIGNTALVAEVDRVIVSSTDTSTAREVTWTADFNSVTMSGRTLTEFGIFSPASAGTCWNREAFGSIIFDGTSELQIQLSFQIY